MKRYLFDGSVTDLPCHDCDVLIVGAGLAGLYTALSLNPDLSVIILNKHGLSESNSMHAQGGIAAAMAADDSPDLHFEDSLAAGCYMGDPAAIRVLVEEGPADIRALKAMSVPFDCDKKGALLLGQEGAHSRKRIVHCHGDATGFYTTSRLADLVALRPNIRMDSQVAMVDLVTRLDGSVAGVIALNTQTAGDFHLYRARQTVLAAGGIGQLFLHSTNARPATGDVLAAAIRAGAVTRDLEFVQFHPTALPEPDQNGRCFLISEAVRGEGAILRSIHSEPFMEKAHPLGNLAPRDVVSQAIFRQMLRDGSPHVYLDITHHSADFLRQRFPMIYETCLQRGLDMARDFLPVAPVQHYFMGGITTDLDARTSLDGLLACGEVASTGIYGANRLASNSLLECLVFGRRAAQSINQAHPAILASLDELAQAIDVERGPKHQHSKEGMTIESQADTRLAEARQQIRLLMTQYCGILRNREGLQTAARGIAAIHSRQELLPVRSVEALEVTQMAVTAQAIIAAALRRRHSIGAHFRTDEHPQTQSMTKKPAKGVNPLC
jgi:L-aspartate oxidase